MSHLSRQAILSVGCISRPGREPRLRATRTPKGSTMTTIQVEAKNTTELLEALPPLAQRGKAVPYFWGGEDRVLISDPVAIHSFMSVPVRRESAFMDVNRRVMGQGLLVT